MAERRNTQQDEAKQAADDTKQQQADVSGGTDAGDSEALSRLEEAGATFGEGTDGVTRLTSAPDDENPDKDAQRVGPVVTTQAPQNWDDNAARFTAGKLDPYAENVDAANEAQSRATIAHQIKGESS